MEEEVQPRSSLLMACPTVRFLGFFNEPDDSDSNPFELDESDVIWSPDRSDSPNLDSIESNSPRVSSSSLSNSPSYQGHHHSYSFRCEKFGLSAALSEDHRSFVQRKAALSSSFSSAVGMIPASSGYSSDGKFHQSAPVNVPIWPKVVNGGNDSERLGFFEEEDEETEEEEMLPPHEIVARSHSTTFSVFEGVGRTLKGRDLRSVRNAVWQKTVSEVDSVNCV